MSPGPPMKSSPEGLTVRRRSVRQASRVPTNIPHRPTSSENATCDTPRAPCALSFLGAGAWLRRSAFLRACLGDGVAQDNVSPLLLPILLPSFTLTNYPADLQPLPKSQTCRWTAGHMGELLDRCRRLNSNWGWKNNTWTVDNYGQLDS